MEVVLDEPVESKADTEALGIMTGDIVCFDPRTTVTESGYIKSRFLARLCKIFKGNRQKARPQNLSAYHCF